MKKLLTVLTLLAALLITTTGSAFAQDTTPIEGTIQLIEVLPPDATTGEVLVAVTLLDPVTNTTQIVNLTLANAEALGLVTTDATTGVSTASTDLYNTPISIDPALTIPDAVEAEEEPEHPVGSALGEFFGDLIGVEYDAIMEAHDDGFGFGVIAQALWLTNQIEGGEEDFIALLEAKKSGDYSEITLADGSTPENWGDVVTSLKKGENLGSVRSGKADNGEDAATDTETQTNGKSNGNSGRSTSDSDSGNNGQGKDKGNNGKGNGGGNGKGKP